MAATSVALGARRANAEFEASFKRYLAVKLTLKSGGPKKIQRLKSNGGGQADRKRSR